MLATILVVGAVGAIGFGVYQAGVEQGLVENGANVVAEVGRDGFRGWGGPGWGGPGWGFGIFGLIFRVLFFVLVFGLIARLFFGPRRWGPPGPYWAYRGGDAHHPGVDDRLTEWHDNAHGGSRDPGPKPERDDT